jgi:phage minor structural protein
MSDKQRSTGYFSWIPIEYYRERPKGIVISSASYPTSFTNLYKQKLDFAVLRASYQDSSGVYQYDSFFTSNNIQAFESRNIKTLAYHQITNTQARWTQVFAESHAQSLYSDLSNAYRELGQDFIPVLVFSDNTTAFNISALYQYLDWFKTEWERWSDKEIIFRSDYSTFSYCTYDTSVRIADLFPKLMLDKAESTDYDSIAYPKSIFTKFDRWVDWAFWIYTSSNSLGATYGLTTTSAKLIIADTNYINRLAQDDDSIPAIDIFILNENLETMGVTNAHNLIWQRRINAIDVLDGEIWSDINEIAEDNYILFLDPFRQVWELFQIKEIDYNINSKNIYAEHIIHTLLDDVVHSTSYTGTGQIDVHITNILSTTYSTNQIWTMGTKYGYFGNTSVVDQKGKNVLEALFYIKDVFGAELVFRPVINSRRIDALSENYQAFAIDCYHRIGKNDNTYRLEVGKNVVSIERHADSKDIATAILPRSTSVSDATWLAYSATAGSGTYVKALNSRLIYYAPSRDRYARNIFTTQKNRIKYYSGTETTASALFDNAVLTLQAMDKEPKISYDLELFDVEVVLGDEITVYNSDINTKIWGEDLPEVDDDYGTTEYFYNKKLRISGRVQEVKYELNDMRNVRITIGDVIEDFTDTYTN